MTPARQAAQRVAVLIDADQFSLAMLDRIMDMAQSHGTVVVLRAYQHWSAATRKGWAKARARHGVEEIEQAPGRNATDMALAIDAVDLTHDRGLDCFVVVSSDKDFAALAGRLRRGRLKAVLIGDEKKIDNEHRKLWDQFIPLPSAQQASPKAAPKATASKAAPEEMARVKAYRDAIIAAKPPDPGWARISVIGKNVSKDLRPKSPSKWLQGRPEFEVSKRKLKADAKKEEDCVRIRKGA